MEELIGKVVVGLRVGEGEEYLVFDHPDGTHTTYETYGDCCSETWFADIVGVDNLLCATVMEVEYMDIDGDECDERCRQEYDEHYGVKLKTNKGYVDIVYRNSSNGYYGGSIDLYTGTLPNIQFTQITDDWSA